VRDSFARLKRKTRDSVNVHILYQDLFETPKPTDAKKKMWLAGYYFNNALLRMVALAEITLKLLFEREMKMKSPNNYWCLVGWYKRKFAGKLKYIASARARVNKFKHDPRDRTKPKALESYADGLKAFKELLKLMSLIC